MDDEGPCDNHPTGYILARERLLHGHAVGPTQVVHAKPHDHHHHVSAEQSKTWRGHGTDSEDAASRAFHGDMGQAGATHHPVWCPCSGGWGGTSSFWASLSASERQEAWIACSELPEEEQPG